MTPFPTTHARNIPARVDAELTTFLDRKIVELGELRAGEAAHLIKDCVLEGGKRLQGMWCYWGWQAGGREDCPEIITVGAALELFHWAALIVDDIFDRSDTRRGLPALHRRLADQHLEQGWHGDPDHYGLVQTLCLTDIAWAWSDELMFASGMDPRLLATRRLPNDLLRSEVWLGQYLDMAERARRAPSLDKAMNVALLKTARSNTMYPLQFGAELADAPAEVISAFKRFGEAVGEAYQLQDDLLGVFGDERLTGKSSTDDFRNGCMTILLSWAMERATPAQLKVFERHHGDPDLDETGAAALRAVVEETGARATIEAMIEDRRAQAVSVLDEAPIADEVRRALTELAVADPVRAGMAAAAVA
ncbi:polyprenyl synthetase family protein [Saccharothrix sp. ST-888]|uniref:polyprenyl synthetase family protein n=1 Tax=Saccharothrix sp. ST-888 TaxID=1427391 RepID=UPI0005EBFEF1|nr:polyprenyl synthetase family protein [Saccharothrix sp. ST-888]